MFQFPPFASFSLWIQERIPRVCLGGFPHSEISGSTVICTSPKLIAACRVLHRRQMPRHPPCALVYFQHHLRSSGSRLPAPTPAAVLRPCSVLVKDACISQGIWSTGKELPPRMGGRFPRKKESGKKDETVTLFRASGSGSRDIRDPS